MRTKKRPPENLRRPPGCFMHTKFLHRVDASREPGQFTPGRIAVKCALLRATMQFWHGFLVRGLGRGLVAAGDGFLDLAQVAADATTACAIALAAGFCLADSFLRGSAVSHFKFRSSYISSGMAYRAVRLRRQARTAGVSRGSSRMRDHGGPTATQC